MIQSCHFWTCYSPEFSDPIKWSIVVPKKLTFSQKINKFPAFVELRGSLTPSQNLARFPYPELDEITARHISYLHYVHYAEIRYAV
jgi:hypothetical protein